MTPELSIVESPEQATFDDFWKECPKRVDKMLAKAKWDAITSPDGLSTRIKDRETGELVEVHLKATPDELVAGMKRYDRSVRTYKPGADWGTLKDDSAYICHPSTWLNRGRWLDD